MSAPECDNTRKIIFDNISWINNLDVRLDVDDPNYWEQTDELDLRLIASRQAFNKRSHTCKMISDEEDSYACEDCQFSVAINIDSVTG